MDAPARSAEDDVVLDPPASMCVINTMHARAGIGELAYVVNQVAEDVGVDGAYSLIDSRAAFTRATDRRNVVYVVADDATFEP